MPKTRERKPPAELMHERFSAINPKARMHPVLYLEPEVHAFFGRSTIEHLRSEEVDLEKFTKGYREEVNRITQNGGGTSTNVKYYLGMLERLANHIEQKPHETDAKFKSNLLSAIGTLKSHEGNIMTTVCKGRSGGGWGMELEAHEAAHSHVIDYIGRYVLNSFDESDAKTGEGLATYLQVALSGVHDGKTFDEANQRNMLPHEKSLYGEPARKFHELISTGETINEIIVDGSRLKKVLDLIKHGWRIDALHMEALSTPGGLEAVYKKIISKS